MPVALLVTPRRTSAFAEAALVEISAVRYSVVRMPPAGPAVFHRTKPAAISIAEACRMVVAAVRYPIVGMPPCQRAALYGAKSAAISRTRRIRVVSAVSMVSGNRTPADAADRRRSACTMMSAGTVSAMSAHCPHQRDCHHQAQHQNHKNPFSSHCSYPPHFLFSKSYHISPPLARRPATFLGIPMFFLDSGPVKD